jgi:hypothetical protein
LTGTTVFPESKLELSTGLSSYTRRFSGMQFHPFHLALTNGTHYLHFLAIQLNSTPSEVGGDISAALSQSIEEGLCDLLGERSKEAVFSYIEQQGFLRHQIPEDLSRFDAFLEENFGKAGNVIARHIASRLYSRLGLDLVTVPHLALSDYVDIASRRLIRSAPNRSITTSLVRRN